MLHVGGGNPEKGMACIWMRGYPGPAFGGEWDICGHWVAIGAGGGFSCSHELCGWDPGLGPWGVDLNSSLTAKQGCTSGGHLVATSLGLCLLIDEIGLRSKILQHEGHMARFSPG